MATVYGERTDGCGSVGCLTAVAIMDCSEDAAATRRRIATDDNLPERPVSMLDVAVPILGLDPATRNALFCGVGSRWFEDLATCRSGPSSTPSTSRDARTFSSSGYVGGLQGLNKLNPVLVSSMSMESGISLGCGVLMSHAILYSC